MSQFFPLEIKEVIRETPQAVSLSFNIPENLKEEFKFDAGQYITIKIKLGDQEIRRAYSLCSAPNSGEFKVTVKEVEGGRFSVLANNKLHAGEVLEVHPPEGKFILKPTGEARNYAAFAAGSGITPVLSIIKTVLAEEPKSRFVLTYGNKSPQDTIFFKELLELQAKFPDRLFIEFVYSRTREDNSHFGRIETSTVNFVVKNKFKDHPFDAFYLCGPEEMINQVSDVL
jgi:ring-1,2-phenylacetyl-CoA epoxidase subunit PaaE